MVVAVTAALVVTIVTAAPAVAHHVQDQAKKPPEFDVQARKMGPVAAPVRAAQIGAVTLADPTEGHPSRTDFHVALTRNPETAALLERGFTTPDEACAPPVCSEYVVDVPRGASPRTLYARLAWRNSAHYVHLWGIAPDGSVVGRSQVADSYDKATGNELTIPIAEFTVADPQAGQWRIQARAVFGHEIPVDGLVALAAGPPVAYPTTDVRALADRHLTQKLTFNIVFAGRTWTPQEIATFRDNIPAEYRLSVHGKQVEDCNSPDSNGLVAIRSWAVCYFSGTDGEGAPGAKPYFEPVKFTFEPRFLQADERWTRDLFAAMRDATKHDDPFENGTQATYAANYDATQGRANRGAGATVANPRVGDKIDAVTVEDWVMQHRLDPAYASSFRDLESGKTVSARFISPDPAARYDPFYDGKGFKDLETMPQGPATSVTFFVLDTFTDAALTAPYFDRDAYHYFDVNRVMIDPDSGRHRGPDYGRVWGGRYRFFLHDLGAGPNAHEVASSFTGNVAGSASYPDGDPPIWDYDHDARWQGMLAERTARDATTMLLYRFVAPYVYRPIPADVYLLAANNWHDCYANPECSPDGIAKTDMTKLYNTKWTAKNLGASLPAATFRTEESDPHLRTYRYLGCAAQRAVANPNPAAGAPAILVPDPNCVGKPSDPIQEVLELAKTRGDDLVSPGVGDFGAAATVVRKYVEEHRDEIAPQPPGQFTIVSVSTVFPGSSIWTVPIPNAAGGVAWATPNGDAWGILQSVNDLVKPSTTTDCSVSSPLAPGCGITPPIDQYDGGFSYPLSHEAAHFFGLNHPHDSLVVEKDAQGKWQRYGYSYRHYGDFSQAPTSYAGAFSPYSVVDQDILQRGHAGEHLRQMQDRLADAYLLDGAAGRAAPSAATLAKVAQAARWRDMASSLFACGDYLKAERAMRNASLAAEGIDGPIVAARELKPGERVLFEVTPQPVYGPDGEAVVGCVAGPDALMAGGAGGAGSLGAAGGQLPATGGTSTGATAMAAAFLALVAFAGVLVARRSHPQ